MLKIAFEDIRNNRLIVQEAYEKGKGAPLLFDPFISKSMNHYRNNLKDIKYPIEIKLPKPLNDLLKGDFEPAKIIRIEEDIFSPTGVPMWYKTTEKGIPLLCGFRGGDSRFPSSEVLDDYMIHGFIGGSSGQGKSVLLYCLLFSLGYMCAPWEVNIVFCDAKINEGMNIALNAPIPHISAIAATDDTDYIISVLQDLIDEMAIRNSIYAKVGANDIEGFRKKTQLCIPQTWIVVDELQAMYLTAGPKSKQLDAIYDAFGRKGRNGGYHLLLTSQEVDGSIPDSTLNNVALRMCLGSAEKVSEKILGNSGAMEYFNKKGNLLVGHEFSATKIENNIHYKIPLLPKDNLPIIHKMFTELSDKFDFKRDLSFYDQNDLVVESEWLNNLGKFKISDDRILLGEPSYIVKDSEKVVKLKLDGKDIENIYVSSPQGKEISRVFKMLDYYFFKLNNKEETHFMLNSSNDLDGVTMNTGFRSIDTSTVYSTSYTIAIAKNLSVRRNLCLAIDDMIYSGNYDIAEEDELIFSELIKENPDFDSTLFKRRIYCLRFLTSESEEYGKWFSEQNPKTDKKDVLRKQYIDEASLLFAIFTKHSSTDTKLVASKLSRVWFWIVGMDKIRGLGKDYKSTPSVEFKNLMQDSVYVNIRFIVFSRGIGDVTEVVPAFRWFILSKVNTSEVLKIKAQEEYPGAVSPNQLVLFDISEDESNKCKKMKKMLFDGEPII